MLLFSLHSTETSPSTAFARTVILVSAHSLYTNLYAAWTRLHVCVLELSADVQWPLIDCILAITPQVKAADSDS